MKATKIWGEQSGLTREDYGRNDGKYSSTQDQNEDSVDDSVKKGASCGCFSAGRSRVHLSY